MSESFKFTIPTLPKNAYEFVCRVSKAHEASNWHVILMGLRALAESKPEQRQAIRELIMRRYPYPGFRNGLNMNDEHPV